MTDRTCPECGEVKPTKKFLDAARRVVSTCTDCRRKAQARARYRKSRKAEHSNDLRLERNDALYAQEQLLGNDPAAEVLDQIKELMYAPRHKLRKYLLKVEAGTATLRTEDGIRRQRQKMDYLEHLCEIIKRDAQAGRSATISHYLTNTYVLNEHDYTCAINPEDDDIRIHKTKEFFDANY
jgi:hypothetical protein